MKLATSSLQGCRWDDLAEEKAQEQLPHDDLRFRGQLVIGVIAIVYFVFGVDLFESFDP